MKYVGKEQPIETRKKIKEQQTAWNQAKWRASSIDRANQIVDKYYRTHVDQFIIKGS